MGSVHQSSDPIPTAKGRRMNWDEYALLVATSVAEKSKDPWCKVGSCLLRHDHSIASVGYNGFPAGMREDWGDRTQRRQFVIHAEHNALRYVRPGECYLIASTTLPCNDCLKGIASYGISRIVYRQDYDLDDSTKRLARAFRIKLTQLK